MAASQTPSPPQPAPLGPLSTDKKFIKIVQHSMLFYWWPVWVVGFILAAISFFSGDRMAVLPHDAVLAQAPPTESSGKAAKYTITFNGPLPRELPRDAAGAPQAIKLDDANSPFHVHMARTKSLGVIWAITLLMVIFITNVPLRGMWSVVIMVSLVLISIIFFLAGIWEWIFDAVAFLSIHINTGGYVFISTVLMLLWVITVYLFDQSSYWIFTPGQLRTHDAIGGGEKAFDTRGMTTEKHRDDLFRHWILGLGTGDLTIKTSGADPREFRIQNVWWVGHKLAQIQEMQRDLPVVSGRS